MPDDTLSMPAPHAIPTLSLAEAVNRWQPVPPSAALVLALLAAALATPGRGQTTVAHWRFEEGSSGQVATGAGTIRDDAGSHHGTPTGDPVYRDSSAPGSTLGLELDSGDSVRIPDDPAFRLQSLTVEACVRIDSFPSGSGLRQIFFRGDTTGGRDPFYLALFAGANLAFQISDGTNDADPDHRDFLLGAIAPEHLGQLIHVAGTLDDATGSFAVHVNGVTTSRLTNARPGEHASYSNGGIAIGALWDGTSNAQFFDGLIDEVRVTAAALSPSEFIDCGSNRPLPVPTPAPETQVTAGGEMPVVAHAPDGRSVVLWQTDTGSPQILGRFFGPTGAPQGPTFGVSSGAGAHTLPSAAFDALGNLTVVWNRTSGKALRPLSGELHLVNVTESAVVGRFFDPSGAPTTGEVEIQTGSGGAAQNPQVDVDDSGDAIVVWDDGDRVRGRRVDRRGRPAPETLTLSEAAGATPVTASSSGGSFAVAYRADSGALVGRVFDPRGAPTTEEIHWSESDQIDNPAIAMDDEGRFVAVWDEPGPGGRDVRGRRFTPAGVPEGPPFDLSEGSGPDQSDPDAAMTSVGDFAVTWVADALAGRAAATGNLVGRLFSPSGQPATGEVEIATTTSGEEPTEPSVSVDDSDDVLVAYTRRGSNGRNRGIFRTGFDGESGIRVCTPEADTLCIQGGRFRVTVSWEDKAGAQGDGQATSLTADTGYFWFFDHSNVEIVVKILDGCTLNDRFWVFAGGLTDVEAKIRVEDTATGQVRTYFNAQDQKFAPIQDTSAFATCTSSRGAGNPLSHEALTERANHEMTGIEWQLRRHSVPAAGSSAACSSDDALCLGGDRFEVRVTWATSTSSGVGRPQTLTSDTGYFWFFDRANVEMVLKILDGCGLNGHFWVFAGGLTDQAVRIEVLDTATGTVVEYSNGLGVPFQPIQDTAALAVCP